jgi:hypothetical protein
MLVMPGSRHAMIGWDITTGVKKKKNVKMTRK